MDPQPPDALTAEDALRRIADVAGKQSSLRSRFEGMTWVLWGLVAALQAVTFGFVQQADIPKTQAGMHVVGLASHLWIVAGIAASVGIWRAAAVNFDPGISRHRALAFFIGWPASFALAVYVVTQVGGGGAFGFAAVTTLLLGAFAGLNPVRFTARGRWTAAVLAVASAVIAFATWTFGSGDPAWYAIAGSAIGLSWVTAGLYCLYQG
jgi:hypothetical protein